MGFLGDLADQLGEQFSFGENKIRTLSENGVNYAKLGDFASQFDRSAERRYVEEGYLRRDAFNTDSKQFEVLMQEPRATVFVKKRMFSSLGDNFRPEYMDKQERMFYKASQLLFYNKCSQIAALEKLSKLQKALTSYEKTGDDVMSLIFSLSLSLSGNSNPEFNQFTSTIDRLRRIYAFNKPSVVTNWISDNTSLFKSQLGQGTGVIELTNFTNISTTTTTDMGNPGRFSLNIADPYESMVISEYDIEKALSDAGSIAFNSKIFQTAQQDNQQLITDLTSRLNNYRRQRGASPISIFISPDTLLGKRVRAVIDGIGVEIPFEYDALGGLSGGLSIVDNKDTGIAAAANNNGVNVPTDYLFGGEVVGFEGLAFAPKQFGGLGDDGKSHQGQFTTRSELAIFQSLIGTIYTQLTLSGSNKGAIFQNDDVSNYVRKRLRFNFLGKLIIQPMDTVNIYIGSKSQYDNKLLAGLKDSFSGLNYLQALSSIGENLSNAISASTFGLASSKVLSVYAEKAVFVGNEFPTFLWHMIRPQFVNENEGTHVFAGLVESASGTWSDAKFNISVSGSDNSAYLTMGKVNYKPGVDAWAGRIYDPLTPFKTKFDTISTNYTEDTPELLFENKILLGEKKDSKSPLLKFKLGSFAGKPATGDNYVQDRSVDPNTKQIIRTFYAPDGLSYKWKEGIGSFVQFGSSFDLNDPSRVGAPPITADPFAGQDIMNAISLMITGIPYNFATYWKAVSNFDTIANDPESRQSAANSFYTSLRNDLEKRNALWGNFIPFKNLVMDEASFALAQRGLFTILSTNDELEKKILELADLEAKANFVNMSFIINEQEVIEKSLVQSTKEKISKKSNELQGEIDILIESLEDQNESFFTQIGDDISFDFDNFMNLNKDSAMTKLVDPNSRRALRRKVNFLTRRMSYNVRANEDKNLFIVDDFYDKDFDIAAFNQALDSRGMSLYNNDFLDVKSKVLATANLLNLEVFCDTQGHLRVRPPQYNRMPSSIFYKMMYQKRALNIKLFPDFLDKLFETQLSTLREKIEIVEEQIRLDCALLGYLDDEEAEQFLTTQNSGSGGSFAFLSNDKGRIVDLASLKNQALPNFEENKKEDFIKLEEQAKFTTILFNSPSRARYIIDTVRKAREEGTDVLARGFNLSSVATEDSQERINTLIKSIEEKSGQKVSRTLFTFQTPDPLKIVGITPKKYIDIFKVTKDLAAKLSERHKALKLFYEAVKNSAEFAAIDLDDNNKTANSLLSSGKFNNKNVPEVFEHMVEDENYDDYGPNSGKRYIIRNSQILSYTIQENPPDYTYVEVQGTLNPNAPGGLPTELNSFPGGGNALVTGAAIDYDLWRTYGWRQGSPIQVPFLTDPKSQCAPYAVSILSRARKNILGGTISIMGNEYMQPGEVIFLENRGLLFYVKSVSHSFSSGGKFTTQLTLSYGHSPGEYIPTALDVVGKMLYNNRDLGGQEIQRQGSAFNESNFGCLIFDPNLHNSMPIGGNIKGSGGTYGPSNAAIISNIAYTASYMVYSNDNKGINTQATIELRVYADKNVKDFDEKLKSFAEFIRAVLIGEKTLPQEEDALTGNSKRTLITLPPKSVKVVLVNLADENEHRSPSQKAHAAVRNLVDRSGKSIQEPEKEEQKEGKTLTNSQIKEGRKQIRNTLTSYIVDCWLKLDVIPVK